jgi:hypothetical protein
VSLKIVPSDSFYLVVITVVCVNCTDGKIWLSIRDLEMEWISNNDNLDATVVRCARLITADYLMCCADADIGGMCLKDTVVAVYADCKDVGQFCERHVRKMGSVADGLIVDLNILGKAVTVATGGASSSGSPECAACWNISVVRDIADPIPYLRGSGDISESDSKSSVECAASAINVVLYCGDRSSFHIMYVNSSQLYDEHVDVFDEREYILVTHADSVSSNGVIEDASAHADDGVVIVAKGGGSGAALS